MLRAHWYMLILTSFMTITAGMSSGAGYTVVNLGAPSGAAHSYATSMSPGANWVAGYITFQKKGTPAIHEACAWQDTDADEDDRADPEGWHRLGHLGGNDSQASAVNDSGQVVGESKTADGSLHAFLWHYTHGMRDLNEWVTGSNFGWILQNARGINRDGWVTGTGQATDGTKHAFLWVPDGTGYGALTEILPGSDTAYPQAINDIGQVTGVYGGRSFLWDSVNGGRDLLAWDRPDGSTFATGINTVGDVAGYYSLDGTSIFRHAFFYHHAGGGWEDLPALPKATEFSIRDVSDDGKVAGACTIRKRLATLWERDAFGWKSTDLNTVKVDGDTALQLTEARAISDATSGPSHGVIAGFGILNSGGYYRAFLLVPK